jgi:hypothetical protein
MIKLLHPDSFNLNPERAAYESPAELGGPGVDPYYFMKVKCELRANPMGLGVYACQDIQKGALVWHMTNDEALKYGAVMTVEEIEAICPTPEALDEYLHWSYQVGDNLYFSPTEEQRPFDYSIYMNHCCDSNLGWVGPYTLVALRDVPCGLELTYDYALTESAFEPFPCNCLCGTSSCRGRITENDWMRPSVRSKYNGFFNPYLQARIDREDRERGFE